MAGVIGLMKRTKRFVALAYIKNAAIALKKQRIKDRSRPAVQNSPPGPGLFWSICGWYENVVYMSSAAIRMLVIVKRPRHADATGPDKGAEVDRPINKRWRR